MKLENYLLVEGRIIGEVYESNGRFQEGESITTTQIAAIDQYSVTTKSGSVYLLGKKSDLTYKGQVNGYLIDAKGFCRGMIGYEMFKSSKIVEFVHRGGLKLIRTQSGSVYLLGRPFNPSLAVQEEVAQKQGFIKNLLSKLALQ